LVFMEEYKGTLIFPSPIKNSFLSFFTRFLYF